MGVNLWYCKLILFDPSIRHRDAIDIEIRKSGFVTRNHLSFQKMTFPSEKTFIFYKRGKLILTFCQGKKSFLCHDTEGSSQLCWNNLSNKNKTTLEHSRYGECNKKSKQKFRMQIKSNQSFGDVLPTMSKTDVTIVVNSELNLV